MLEEALQIANNRLGSGNWIHLVMHRAFLY